MADDLSFTISASDQASRVVETVQKKIQGFGTDVAKMALGVAGPLALISAGFGLVMNKYNEYQQNKKDARELAAQREIDEQSAITEKEKEEMKKRLANYKKAEEEKTKALKEQEERRKKGLTLTQEIEAMQQNLAYGGELTGADLLKDLSDKIKRARMDFERAQRDLNQGQPGVTNVDVSEAQKKYLGLQIKFREEREKIMGTPKQVGDKVAGADKIKPEETKSVKDAVKVTVSSLREIGGSFGGGDINTGIEAQIELGRKQVDILSVIADNTKPKEPVGTPLEMQDTNFTLPGGKTISAAELLGF